MAEKQEYDNSAQPFWTSRKFAYTALAAICFTVLAVTGTVSFSSDQVLTAILTFFGVGVGSQSLIDYAARPRTIAQPTAPTTTPESSGGES